MRTKTLMILAIILSAVTATVMALVPMYDKVVITSIAEFVVFPSKETDTLSTFTLLHLTCSIALMIVNVAVLGAIRQYTNTYNEKYKNKQEIGFKRINKNCSISLAMYNKKHKNKQERKFKRINKNYSINIYITFLSVVSLHVASYGFLWYATGKIYNNEVFIALNVIGLLTAVVNSVALKELKKDYIDMAG